MEELFPSMSHMLLKLLFPRMNHDVNIHLNESVKGLVTHLAEVVYGRQWDGSY